MLKLTNFMQANEVINLANVAISLEGCVADIIKLQKFTLVDATQQ